MSRIRLIAAVLLGYLAFGCDGHASSSVDKARQPAILQGRVDVLLNRPGRPVNRHILGSNVQWVDRGDDLLEHDGAGFAPKMMDLVGALGPTMLRYPGGSLSDLYHWRDGIGPLTARGHGERFFSRRRQPILMGTSEFLSLCARLGATPLITVNTATGTAKEAAQWLAYTDRRAADTAHTPLPLPQVRYWEIGNEPYLKDERHPDLWIDPSAFAKRANRFIRALREQDPDILIGIPLRSDLIGGKPANPYPGYDAIVLKTLDRPVDFVALHDAYLPFIDGKAGYSAERLYWASMAAAYTVEADLAATRRELARAGWKKTRLAVTEYSPMYTLSGKATDNYVATLTGALYVADLLRVFANQPDLLTAEYWSLTGNGAFGAISNRGVKRPVYGVLEIYNRLLHGHYVPLNIKAATMDVQGAGYVPPMRAMPLLTGVATRDHATARLLLLNKDPRRPIAVQIDAGDGEAQGGIDSIVFGATNRPYFEGGPIALDRHRLDPNGGAWTVTLPPHSVTLLEWRLPAKAGVSPPAKRPRP